MPLDGAALDAAAFGFFGWEELGEGAAMIGEGLEWAAEDAEDEDDCFFGS